MHVESFRSQIHDSIDRGLGPLTRVLAHLGVRPNQSTVAGTLICLAAPVLLIAERPVLAGVVWLVGCALDLVDGALARNQGQETAGGAFLDSTLDRISEGALFAAITYHFAQAGDALAAQTIAVDGPLPALGALSTRDLDRLEYRGEALLGLDHGQHQYTGQVIQAHPFTAWCITTAATAETFSTLVGCLHLWRVIAERHKRFTAVFKGLDHLSTADLVSLATGGKLPNKQPTHKNIDRWEQAIVGARLTPTANKPTSMFREALQKAGAETREQEEK